MVSVTQLLEARWPGAALVCGWFAPLANKNPLTGGEGGVRPPHSKKLTRAPQPLSTLRKGACYKEGGITAVALRLTGVANKMYRQARVDSSLKWNVQKVLSLQRSEMYSTSRPD
ncbi:MAG: hypothetical protein QOE77_1714 [Blastocatellia bacterium]|jgi:hypothetical protein|nr:hypothetical protein [Blastocatellia bacterium]